MTPRVWFTSDLHIGHRNIVTYCARPFSGVDENDLELARLWNERVAADDVVWVLGDLSFLRLEPTRRYLEALAGRKKLVRGNHDSRSQCRKLVESGHLESIHDEVDIVLDVGGGPVAARARHAPDFASPWPMGTQLGLHGHCHEKGWLRVRHDGRWLVNVGVDQWNFRPVSAEEIVARVNAATDADVWRTVDPERDVRRGLPSHYVERRT